MTKRVEVAAAVIERPDGTFLLGQRAPDTFYPGYWEFPGGKLEPGENAQAALVRELEEELGLSVQRADPWIVREHQYEHAHVRLHFFRVRAWQGEVRDHVHSALEWQRADALSVSPMLPANAPVLRALALPMHLAITSPHTESTSDTIGKIDALAQHWQAQPHKPMVMLRKPEMSDAEFAQYAYATVPRIHQHQLQCVVHGRIALAEQLQCGVHLSSRQLMQTTTRPNTTIVGASCHNAQELQHAAQLGMDYAVLGAVLSTPTHPNDLGMGWEKFAQLVQGLPMPVFAIGGTGPANIDRAWQAGAHGVAGISAYW